MPNPFRPVLIFYRDDADILPVCLYQKIPKTTNYFPILFLRGQCSNKTLFTLQGKRIRLQNRKSPF